MTDAVGFLPMQRPRQSVPNDEEVEINERVWFVDHDGFRVVFLGIDTPLFRVAVSDKADMRLVAVSLRFAGHAKQLEIARAFGHSVKSQRRWERRYEEDGSEGLRPRPIPGPATKIDRGQEKYVRKWFAEGKSNFDIAGRLGVDEATIRRTLKRLDLKRQAPTQQVLATSQGSIGEPSIITERQPGDTADVANSDAAKVGEGKPVADFWSPLDRSFDRAMARAGLLDDALPIFADADRLPRAGVLLTVPLLTRCGFLEGFESVYRTLGPAFYGLRTTVVCLLFLAMLRIKRPEHLKEYHPPDLGRLLGLDRAPEVKTLRRKLHALGSRKRGVELMHELAKARVEKAPEILGVLYVDGHVREYHGKSKIAKTHVTQRGLCVPAATDTWVNDVQGDPLFVVQSEVNEGLTKVLESILDEARELAGPERELTVVFDRGGWSPKLFERLIAAGHHIITYRKRPVVQVPESRFEKRELSVGGKRTSYVLHDAPKVKVGRSSGRDRHGRKYVWMRQVTRLRQGDRQTAVLTDRHDLPAELVLHLMFNRWRQENYFKYMAEEFALDALVEYGAEPISEGIDRPNPALKAVEKELRGARKLLADAERSVGELFRDVPPTSDADSQRFEVFMRELSEQQRRALARVEKLKERKKSLPARVWPTTEKTLRREVRFVVDAVKMSAYQMEGALMRMLSGIYTRNDDEGRTLLHAAFQSRGSIEVNPSELIVTLEPQSSPHRTQALSRLCDELNALGETRFPGTDQVLRLRVRASEPVTS